MQASLRQLHTMLPCYLVILLILHANAIEQDSDVCRLVGHAISTHKCIASAVLWGTHAAFQHISATDRATIQPILSWFNIQRSTKESSSWSSGFKPFLLHTAAQLSKKACYQICLQTPVLLQKLICCEYEGKSLQKRASFLECVVVQLTAKSHCSIWGVAQRAQMAFVMPIPGESTD